ncbi:MAG TPA: hypothetical protein VFW96_07065 [Thermomicrobiales bacterium]|nr:hypothetical protein [Thermomicrobiales bacterium]
MQEQIMNQLVQVLQERAGLDQQKAQQVAQVVSDFAQQHADELGQLAMQQMGGEGGVMGKLGGMFGNRS